MKDAGSAAGTTGGAGAGNPADTGAPDKEGTLEGAVVPVNSVGVIMAGTGEGNDDGNPGTVTVDDAGKGKPVDLIMEGPGGLDEAPDGGKPADDGGGFSPAFDVPSTLSPEDQEWLNWLMSVRGIDRYEDVEVMRTWRDRLDNIFELDTPPAEVNDQWARINARIRELEAEGSEELTPRRPISGARVKQRQTASQPRQQRSWAWPLWLLVLGALAISLCAGYAVYMSRDRAEQAEQNLRALLSKDGRVGQLEKHFVDGGDFSKLKAEFDKGGRVGKLESAFLPEGRVTKLEAKFADDGVIENLKAITVQDHQALFGKEAKDGEPAVAGLVDRVGDLTNGQKKLEGDVHRKVDDELKRIHSALVRDLAENAKKVETATMTAATAKAQADKAEATAKTADAKATTAGDQADNALALGRAGAKGLQAIADSPSGLLNKSVPRRVKAEVNRVMSAEEIDVALREIKAAHAK
ncbi:MAG: hypothetical protein WC516_04065 [Patescibacteria group bacterium]